MSKRNDKKGGDSFLIKLSSFIVDKKSLIFLVFIILLVFSAFSRNWVEVENALDVYLPDDSETRQGIDIMDEQFTTFGTAEIMFANITLDEAQQINERLSDMDGVQSVSFDDSTEHYNNVSALYDITFDYDEDDERCLDSLDAITEAYSAYDTYISTDLGNADAESLSAEINAIMVFVALIVVSVLILTSETYAEIPVLILTFLSAMVINIGTNFLLGKISFVSNSVTAVLQLALSLDYAVIFCNRFKEEHRLLPTREAVIVALSKAIPEISASSLTTIGGLCAMLFMELKIGPDLAICLIKSIFIALLSVFLLMPGLLVVFAPLMDKSHHRSFIPKVPFIGKFAYATRRVIPPLFILVLVAALYLSGKCPYAYGQDNIPTPQQNDTQIAKEMIDENFSSSNMVALVVPAGDYETEAEVLSALEKYTEVDYTIGLCNIEATDGYMLTDKLNPRQFSELADLDYEATQLIYTAYATENEEYGKIVGGLSTYSVPLMDMFMFVHDQVEDGYVTLSAEQKQEMDDAYEQMYNAKLQLCGEEYSRMLVYLTLPLGSDTTYAFLDTIRDAAQSCYPEGNVYIVGNATTEYDFEKSFSHDNTIVSIVSILIVLVVLLFTFKSAAMPILLILVIQGSIWINFSVPAITGNEIFFMSYLVVSSIQMGANIDYAIVIGSRFMEQKDKMSKRDAIIETMNFAFPTIITSGTILAAAGILISAMTSDAAITGIGCIGRGTIISMLLVMFVLPQILLLGEKLIDKTSFVVKNAVKQKRASGKVRIDGVVHGDISGVVSGTMHAMVDGDVNVKLISGSAAEDQDEDEGGDDAESRGGSDTESGGESTAEGRGEQDDE
ncbi:MAG TPA: MMPL family transporter [Eubacteriales bacterium]|nr:MMPL family transporter [Eubacteriales bacterium]